MGGFVVVYVCWLVVFYVFLVGLSACFCCLVCFGLSFHLFVFCLREGGCSYPPLSLKSFELSKLFWILISLNMKCIYWHI